ncbi:hypothetical protein ACNKHM_07680 [Shigella sonnei]
MLEIVRFEKPKGVIVQYAVNPAETGARAGSCWRTGYRYQPDAIDRAEDRERFQTAVQRLKLKQPATPPLPPSKWRLRNEKDWLPAGGASVLRSRRSAMEIVYDEADLRRYFQRRSAC